MPQRPLTGFHFDVTFFFPEIKEVPIPFAGLPLQMAFKSVDGLKMTWDQKEKAEGGQNGYSHTLPGRMSYDQLTLTRGLTPANNLRTWISVMKQFSIVIPVNLTVSLLNDKHQPVVTWLVNHAVPVSWDFGGLDATSSDIVMETMTLKYQDFSMLPVNLLN